MIPQSLSDASEQHRKVQKNRP